MKVTIFEWVGNMSERLGRRFRRIIKFNSFIQRTLVDILLIPADLRSILIDHRREIGRIPNLIRPKTFNEFIQRRKLVSRKRIYRELSDKLEVRTFVARRVGKKYLSQIHWRGLDARNIPKKIFVRPFVLKANHASNMVHIVNCRQVADSAYIHEQTQRWLRQDVSLQTGEWQYRWIHPELYAEEYLCGGRASENLVDYKFFCFSGAPRIVEIVIGRQEDMRIVFVNNEFEAMPIVGKVPVPDSMPAKPPNWHDMKRVASVLSEGFEFVRVDLYDTGTRVVFGEMTFTPAAGCMKMWPRSWDERLGEWYREALRTR